MRTILDEIRTVLNNSSDPENRESGRRFFKEEVKLYGVKTAEVGKISRQYFKTLNGSNKSDIFNLCDELWKSGYMEESFIACDWAYNLNKEYEPGDFSIFESWVSLYVNNWASCDTLCNHTIGTFIEMYPKYLSSLKKWAKSENRWMRRASAVSLIIPARRGKFLDEIFSIADILLLDNDDLVQKGYGWMLKAASEAHQKKVFDFVMEKRDKMPRTALRYAIEKMPVGMKKMAMEKG
ncbi:MAG: DNA alkylation repair protein [Fibrobacter sp.]|nr:DNA alkylation repair protein [Fibrobacter sp.]